MDLGEERKVHEVKPKQNPYKGDEVKPNRQKTKKKEKVKEKEKVGT